MPVNNEKLSNFHCVVQKHITVDLHPPKHRFLFFFFLHQSYEVNFRQLVFFPGGGWGLFSRTHNEAFLSSCRAPRFYFCAIKMTLDSIETVLSGVEGGISRISSPSHAFTSLLSVGATSYSGESTCHRCTAAINTFFLSAY